MVIVSCCDWHTPQAFVLPEMGPGLDAVALQQLEKALLNISCDPSVQALVLFGSRAAGTARKDSDLDFLVISRILHLEPTAKVEFWWNHYRKLQGLTLEVDLIVSGISDADKFAGSRWHVIGHAARTGKIVWVASP